MKIIKVQDNLAGGQAGYQVFADALNSGATTFGLATGSTPISIYDAITASDLDFSKATSVNLDEYVGLAADHDQSYHYFMQQHFFDAKPFAQSFVPAGDAADVTAELAHYDDVIATHPVDLQILGLGQNAHIGFNEPGTPFASKTHLVDLTPSTIAANARFFADAAEVPTQAITMGISQIMEAKQILMVAYGANKAEAVKAMLEGPVTEDVPASILQQHANVVVILDDASARLLTK